MRSRHACSAVEARSRHARGTLAARSKRGRGTPEVRLRYARGAVRFGRGTLVVRSRCASGTLTAAVLVRCGTYFNFLSGGTVRTFGEWPDKTSALIGKWTAISTF